MCKQKITMASWKDIKDGYGLQEVPDSYRRDCMCIICSVDHRNKKLYTTEPLAYDGTTRGFTRMLDKIRTNCYCRIHAEDHYGY